MNKREYMKPEDQEFVETAVQIKRTSKKTKGGDRLSFTCLSVVGDRKGRVGIGLAKAPAVVAAINKANRKAKNHMVRVLVVGEANTIPHRVEVSLGASRILLKPAPAGTGVRAGTAVRALLEAAGIQNIVTKVLGSGNIKGNVDATLVALQSLRTADKRVTKKKK